MLLWLLDYFLTALVIAWLTAFQWAALCWGCWTRQEDNRVRRALYDGPVRRNVSLLRRKARWL